LIWARSCSASRRSRASRRLRLAWRLIALGLTGQLLGSLVAGLYEIVLERKLLSRTELDRLLKRDPLRLRRLVPRRVKQHLYDRRLSGDRVTPRAGALEIAQDDFWLDGDRLEQAIDLFAVCDGPRT